MTFQSVVSFFLVFWLVSLIASLVLGGSILLFTKKVSLKEPWLARWLTATGVWLPPALGLLVTGILVGHNIYEISNGTDHCLDHPHHLHLCLYHGNAFSLMPWGTLLAVLGGLYAFRGIVFGSARQWRANRHRSTLLRAGTPLEGETNVIEVRDNRPFAMVMGMMNPVVFVSSGTLRTLGSKERHAVLAHENAHINNGDLLKRFALGIAAFYGLPFVTRSLLTQWELAVENICDHTAAKCIDAPDAVASAILSMVRSGSGKNALAMTFASAAQVNQRIHSLLVASPLLRQISYGHRAILCAVILLSTGLTLLQADSLHHFFESLLR